MLGRQPFVGFLLITDPTRAKAFYCDLLGLALIDEDDFAVVLDAGGTRLRLAVVHQVPEPGGTNAGWLVDDVNVAARALAAKGVEFERFPGMDQDADGVWIQHGVAWFRDPDGNRLSLSRSGEAASTE
jgi:catechol 2,3-dioxygenase-like lactoylglutathione lyase family enzyme